MRERTWIFKWESKDAHFPGAYYSTSTRAPQLWMVLNRYKKKCWCGKPKNMFEKGRRKHCSEKCAIIWGYGMRATWETTRTSIINDSGGKCEICGNNEGTMEVDHIIARCLGGEPWGSWNLQALCHTCHAKKTKSDIAKLRKSKKDADARKHKSNNTISLDQFFK